MIAFFCKWLPIFFGCHGRADRSFHYKGNKFPLCTRCTGELIGIICAVLYSAFFPLPPLYACAILALPLIIDGFVQRLTRYESNTLKRMVTGFLFGAALVFFFVITGVMSHEFGKELAKTYLMPAEQL